MMRCCSCDLFDRIDRYCQFPMGNHDVGNTTTSNSNYAGKVGSQLVTKIYNYDDISPEMDRILQHICIPSVFEKRKQQRKNSTRENHRYSVCSRRIPHRYLGVFYLHLDRIMPTFQTPHFKS